MLDKLDTVIRAYTNVCACVYGDPRKKDLPTNQKGVKAKIPYVMIDPQWLVSHANSDTPLHMKGFEDQNCICTEEEDDDDLYGNMLVEDNGEF